MARINQGGPWKVQDKYTEATRACTHTYDTQHAPSSVPGGCQATYDGRAKSPCNRDQLIILLGEHSIMKPAFRRRLGRVMAGSLWFSHFSDFGGGKTAWRREEPTWKSQHSFSLFQGRCSSNHFKISIAYSTTHHFPLTNQKSKFEVSLDPV